MLDTPEEQEFLKSLSNENYEKLEKDLNAKYLEYRNNNKDLEIQNICIFVKKNNI